MKENFAPALAAVLAHEGGYSNHPSDPGGPTMKGVIKRVYDDYRRGKGEAVRDVREITDAELREIYHRRYWDLIQGDALPTGLDYVVFDGAVNSGPAQATKWLQRALGVGADGVLGPETLRALSAVGDHDALIGAILERRLTFLKALRTWPVFGKGWGRRVAEVRDLGQALARGARDLPLPAGTASGKAYAASAKAPPPRGIGDMLAAGGAVSTTLSTAADAITPLAERNGTAATALTFLMAAGALVAVAGILYRQWAKAEADVLADALDLKPPVFTPVGEDAAPAAVAA